MSIFEHTLNIQLTEFALIDAAGAESRRFESIMGHRHGHCSFVLLFFHSFIFV